MQVKYSHMLLIQLSIQKIMKKHQNAQEFYKVVTK